MSSFPTPSRSESSPRSKRREEAYRQILALIIEGRLEDGDRLPSEGNMATRFGISRPIIREALSELQQAGVVNVRRGAGSFVRSASALGQADGASSSFGPVRSLADVRQCYEFRAYIEGEAAALAAERRPAQPMRDAENALMRMERAIASKRPGAEASSQFEADFEFHRAIANAAENLYFERVLLSIREPIEFTIGLSRSLSLTFSSHRLKSVQNEHILIFEMIKKGEPEEARRAMHAHMMNACRRVFDGPNESPEAD